MSVERKQALTKGEARRMTEIKKKKNNKKIQKLVL